MGKRPSWSGPGKVFANEKLIVLNMVSTLHGYELQIKSMRVGQFTDFRCVIIGHQEITPQRACDLEKFLMVQVTVPVKTFPRFLAASGVGWINKKHRRIPISVFAEES